MNTHLILQNAGQLQTQDLIPVKSITYKTGENSLGKYGSQKSTDFVDSSNLWS
jgi:hypothetical protein